MANSEELWIPIEVDSCHVPENILPAPLHWRKDSYLVGFLHLEKKNTGTQPPQTVSFEQARRSAVALGDLLSEMQMARVQVWTHELKMIRYAKIMNRPVPLTKPVFAHPFRKLLENTLDNLGMDAVGIYLLNSAGTALKLRVGIGLPLDRLSTRPRFLEEATIDVRSLQDGGISVVDKNSPQEGHALPEDFRSAICLPLLTDHSLMGTVWFFSNQHSELDDFTQRLAEMAADHISGELERAACFHRYAQSLEYRKEVQLAAKIQKNQLPLPATWLKNVGLFGWVRPSRYVVKRKSVSPELFDEEVLSGDFYDWFSLPNGKLLIALGNVGYPGLAGVSVVASVKSALRSHACYEHTASGLLQSVHRTLWQQSAAEGKISLFC
ncbi:MAG: GAF domain-containing protein, partial [Planctomycetia bacterium]|nr:GAF domain-containing protein [Planctomycetia bacterium]